MFVMLIRPFDSLFIWHYTACVEGHKCLSSFYTYGWISQPVKRRHYNLPGPWDHIVPLSLQGLVGSPSH
jgi:hypothetical protein